MGTIISSDVGEGVTSVQIDGTYNYDVMGHCYWPPYPDGFDSSSIITWYVYNPRYTFDLTDYYPGVEVITNVCEINVSSSDTTETMFINPYNSICSIFTYTGVSGTYFFYHYMGIVYNHEINMNGTYISRITCTGSSNWDVYFDITNLDYARLTRGTPYNYGYIWVEGEHIHFIPLTGYNKLFIKHDGNSYGTHGDPGTIWVPNVSNCNYLEYIDENGDHRRTHNGDIKGLRNTGGVPSQPGSAYAGAIWTSTWAWTTALKFINYDGWVVRISVGWVYGNGY